MNGEDVAAYGTARPNPRRGYLRGVDPVNRLARCAGNVHCGDLALDLAFNSTDPCSES